MSCNIREKYVNPNPQSGLKNQEWAIVIQQLKLTKLKRWGVQKELYEIAQKTGLWIVLCNCIKVSGKNHPNTIFGAQSATSGMPSSPITLERRQTLHPDLSIQTSATHSKTARVLPELWHTPAFAIVCCTPQCVHHYQPDEPISKPVY